MANLQFWRSNQMSDTSFLDLVKRTFGKTFTKGIDAKDWLKANGYYTSYPDIVTDGLVLSLDASNSSSFKGEPTTNYLTTSNVIGFNSSWTLQSYSYNNTFVYKNVVTSPNTGNNAGFRILGNITLNQSGLKYLTLSFSKKLITTYSKNLGGYITVYYTDATYEDLGWTYNLPSWAQDDIGVWKKITSTVTLNAGKTPNYVSVAYIYTDFALSGEMDIAEIQLEQKSYSTPFVNGTRGTTNATGGGWCDLSGNGNHGELVNSPLFDTLNLGNVVFNGVNNYISIPDNASLKISGDKSLSCWCYFTSDLSCGIIGKSSSSDGGMALGYGWDGNGFMGLCWNSANAPYIAKDVRDYNNWCFLTVVQSGTTRTIYVYDIIGLRTSNYVGGTHSWNNSVPLMIGNANNGSSLVPSGTKISDVKAYNKALTANEILQNFNATKERFGL